MAAANAAHFEALCTQEAEGERGKEFQGSLFEVSEFVTPVLFEIV